MSPVSPAFFEVCFRIQEFQRSEPVLEELKGTSEPEVETKSVGLNHIATVPQTLAERS